MGKKMTSTSRPSSASLSGLESATSEGARRATEEVADSSKPSKPEPLGLARRRTFTISYKRRIVREADACISQRHVGALLRREGLYTSSLCKWRKEVEASELESCTNKPRGPKPSPDKAAVREIAELTRENDKLRKKLKQSQRIIQVQKNFAVYWGCPKQGKRPDE